MSQKWTKIEGLMNVMERALAMRLATKLWGSVNALQGDKGHVLGPKQARKGLSILFPVYFLDGE